MRMAKGIHQDGVLGASSSTMRPRPVLVSPVSLSPRQKPYELKTPPSPGSHAPNPVGTWQSSGGPGRQHRLLQRECRVDPCRGWDAMPGASSAASWKGCPSIPVLRPFNSGQSIGLCSSKLLCGPRKQVGRPGGLQITLEQQ